MIPQIQTDGTLPPGIHWASWPEVVERFGFNNYRKHLLAGLRHAIDVLKIAGCRAIYLDGSFVTDKPFPNDYDVVWVYDEVEHHMLDAELLDGSPSGRRRQKSRYGGEFFPIHSGRLRDPASILTTFQTNKETGARKGIVAIDLRAEP